MEVRYQTKLTEKSLDFIDDKDLQAILETRLDELERVFGVNGNLSTIILAISCIEGIFKHVAEIFKKDIRASHNYPVNQKGKKKSISDLTIEEMYRLLIEQGILLPIQHFDYFYNLFRNYRNFIHPQAQRKQPWPVGLGQAQMAIGLLNSTIDRLSKYIFIGHEILEKISGRPRYDLLRIHHLDVSNTRTHSFVTLKCIFRSKAATCSGSKRPPVPVQSGHRFRLNPATIWTGPECEVTLDNYSKMGQDISFKRRHKWLERGYPCEKSKKPCG